MITKKRLNFIFSHYSIDPLHVKGILCVKEKTPKFGRFFNNQGEIIFLYGENKYHHVRFFCDFNDYPKIIRKDVYTNAVFLWGMMIRDPDWKVFPADINDILTEIKNECLGKTTKSLRRFSI